MPEFHIEPCHNQAAAMNYCGKDKTKVDGPWEYGELKFAGGDKKSFQGKEWIDKTKEEIEFAVMEG